MVCDRAEKGNVFLTSCSSISLDRVCGTSKFEAVNISEYNIAVQHFHTVGKLDPGMQEQ